MGNSYTEDSLVEQPAIALLAELGWTTANCYHESFGPTGTLGRESATEVVLPARLRPALARLNPDLSAEALTLASEELTRNRSAMSPANANRELYQLLKNGVKVKVRGTDDEDDSVQTVRIVDWDNIANNDFFLASQFWVAGELGRKRADLVGFVNGLPLVFVELKATHKRLENAYNDNLRDYRNTIPQLFWYNALLILSNGSQSRIGSITAGLEHFNEWKKISEEEEQGVISLETMLRGTCEPSRLLDLVENFTLFDEGRGELIKLVGKNHQFLGVNRAVAALEKIKQNQGRLGVFWHTQGSGKSVSMIFFAQKILRKRLGNWTFVIITDRQDLDGQIYKNFANAGVVSDKEAQATSAEHLRQLLREDHRYIFTLIQKFRTDKGAKYPKLSDRSDIIVITDEAHRSQYDTFALNMRSALPNAAFIGFTGTPLMAGEEKTREVFGDYVSIYNFKQSIEDGATVPLYYENRIPELQLKNEDFNEQMEETLDDVALDEDQEKKLEREFAREYHLITRDDRLEKIAADIVSHFMGRGLRGKAMVVSIDKATAIKMYEKVKKHWNLFREGLERSLITASEKEAASLIETIAYIDQLDMAVVVSSSQNEIEEMKKKGLEIEPHRRRMVKEDLESKFKDPKDPFAIVFVCAMWMTGFDVPSCSTIYLDKPMRNHTLMQTIARANRVAKDKVNGLIVDYIGVFRNLQKALAIYAAPTAGQTVDVGNAVKSKAALIEWLKQAITETTAFCAEKGIDLGKIQTAPAQKFQRAKLLKDAEDAIRVNEETKRRYLTQVNQVTKLFKAILPDTAANEFAPVCVLLQVLAEQVRSQEPEIDITKALAAVETLLDESIAAEGYIIRAAAETGTNHLIDLSQIDFDALQAQFRKGRQNTQADKLQTALGQKLNRMVQLNQSRMDYKEHFEQMIAEYNSGSRNVAEHFAQLVEFARSLNQEEQRGIAENLSEEELAVFDLLTKPDFNLTGKERGEVKKVARDLLEALKLEKLVLDWRAKPQAKAAVKLCIEETLDRLPTIYTSDLYEQKCTQAYQHIYDSYSGNGRSIYAPEP